MYTEDRSSFCPFLDNPTGANENVVNYYRSMWKGEGNYRDTLSTCKCSIYDERPIFCRLYPMYPFTNCCTIGQKFQTNIDNLQQYQVLLYQYILQFRTDVLQAQTIDWEHYRPLTTKALVRISPEEVTHYSKIFGYYPPFWSIWTFAIALELDDSQQAILDRCDGTRVVPEIITELELEHDDTIEFLTSLILHGLIVPPEEIKYPKLNNLFYPTL